MKRIIYESNEIICFQIQFSKNRDYIVEITGSSTGDPLPTSLDTHYTGYAYNVVKILTKTQSHIRHLLHFPCNTPECSSLPAVGKDISTFLNGLEVNKLFLLGHSKGGIELLSALMSLTKMPQQIITVSVPAKGTLSANKERAEIQLNSLEKLFYKFTFSNNPLDQAISRATVLEDSGIDMEFIWKKYGHLMTNLISQCPRGCHIQSPADLVCWYLWRYKDLRLSSTDSLGNDGIVTISSQRFPYIKNNYISAFHSSSLDVAREELKKFL